jgi:hypothetical protein|tara:strand:- start:362 stop:568 length:207 start_codon:yes stop_codon:yes gene_type:complete
MILNKINEAARQWNKTKNPYYKDLWYKLIKEFANGHNNINRRVVPFNTRSKRITQGHSFDKKSWLNLL